MKLPSWSMMGMLLLALTLSVSGYAAVDADGKAKPVTGENLLDMFPEDVPATPEVETAAEEPATPEAETAAEEPAAPKVETAAEEPATPEVETAAEEPAAPKVETAAEEPATPEVETAAEDSESADRIEELEKQNKELSDKIDKIEEAKKEEKKVVRSLYKRRILEEEYIGEAYSNSSGMSPVALMREEFSNSMMQMMNFFQQSYAMLIRQQDEMNRMRMVDHASRIGSHAKNLGEIDLYSYRDNRRGLLNEFNRLDPADRDWLARQELGRYDDLSYDRDRYRSEKQWLDIPLTDESYYNFSNGSLI